MFTELLFTGRQSADSSALTHGRAFVCQSCGEAIHLPSMTPGGYTCPTGYAVDRATDGLICYPCADAGQRANMLDRSGPIVAYLASDGRTVTTWTGGKLGDVVHWQSTALPFGRRRSFWHGSSYRAIRVRDVHGAMWHGKTSPGLCVTLRPMKSV